MGKFLLLPSIILTINLHCNGLCYHQLIYIRHTEESKLGSRVVLLGVEVQVKVQKFK